MNNIKKTCKFYLKTPDFINIGQFDNELVCFEERWKDSDYCLFHTDFPEDKNSSKYKNLVEEKNRLLDFPSTEDFSSIGAILPEINFQNKEINGIDLSYSQIYGDAIFTGATIKDYIMFLGTTIKGNLLFKDTKIEGDIFFDAAKIEGNIDLTGANIDGLLNFEELGISGTIEGKVLFDGSKEERDALFKGAIINGKKID